MADQETKLVKRWLDRLATSKKWRDQVRDDANWEKYVDEYKGKYDVVLGNIYIPPINEVYAYTQATIANLFFQNPYIAVNAKKTGTILGAYIWEAILNYWWRELKIKDEVELEIIDTIHIGHGWNKTGVNVKTSGSGDQLRLLRDSYFATRVSWRDMLVNVGCRRPPKDCLWIAQRIYRPTDDVKKDYGRPAAKLNGAPHPSIDEQYRKNIIYKEDINFSAIHEVWDARERKIYLIADENGDSFLEDPRPWPDWLEEYPYEMLQWNDVPDEPYPMSDIHTFNPQILETIKVFTQMLNHVKRWNRQMIIKKGTMTATEIDKFEKGIDGAILSAVTTGDIQTAFKALDFGSLPPDIYMVLDRLTQLKASINGQPEFERGSMTKTSTRTIGELQLMKGGSGARTDRKLDRIERHCENIARHLMAFMKANFSVSEAARITGKEPPEIIKAFADQGKYDPVSQTINFTPEDIIGEYDVTIKAGSTLPLDKLTRDQILDQTLQASIPLAAAPSLPPFIAQIIKERLRDYDIKSLEMAFDQQQQTVQAQQDQQAQVQQAQVEKTKAETAKRQAQAEDINIDSVIKGATAVAKGHGVIAPEASLKP